MIFHSKTQPPPTCLAIEKEKANGNYNCAGVLAQIKADFKNKCYLCEDKEPHTINTEHFIPHRGNKNLKFDWNNLFYCCAHCNNTKSDEVKFDNILNCTIETDEVETNIRYHINPWPKEKVELTPITVSEKISNTIVLLTKVYNGTTELKQIESANLRSKLLREIRAFQDLLFKFYDDLYSEEERTEIKNSIIRQLRPSSNFTAFKKWILRDNEDIASDFADYL